MRIGIPSPRVILDLYACVCLCEYTCCVCCVYVRVLQCKYICAVRSHVLVCVHLFGTKYLCGW